MKQLHGILPALITPLDAAGNSANNGIPPLKQIVILSVAITEA